ncbi:MAG: (4-O-methyl)-D-glucuronate---lignin esterase, partial [Verrucomicrobiota bacterium]
TTLAKKLKQFFILHFGAIAAIGAVWAEVPEDLAQQFQSPPRQAQPWVYWVWVGDTTRAAITRDLEEMKGKGIAGCILYECQSSRGHNWWDRTVVLEDKEYHPTPTGDYPNPYYTPIPASKLVAWTAHWRELVRFAAKECARLGIRFVICDGLAHTSGNISEEFGEQILVWTETSVRGNQTYDGTLAEPNLQAPKGDFPHPAWKKFHRDVAVLAISDENIFSPDKVINLTAKTDAAGHLRWDVPDGSWKILRFVQVPTGARNEWGYFTDSMSAEAMDKTWEATMAPLLKELSPEERRGIKGIEDDSWEAGKTTWTKMFPNEFKKRRGYDLIPYLPMIAATVTNRPAAPIRVQRDYALTISDLIADNHYGRLKKLAKDNGLICYSEAAGPHLDEADLLKTSSKVDMAMAEFWMPSAHRPAMDSRFLLRNAASANHIYGKNITLCESFTSLGPEWEETPFTMKPVADQALCDGLNSLCIHNFSQSPSLTARPGYVYVAGTHYEPGITWWDKSSAFNAYLARCCAMLQAGKFVADAIFYHGDNIGFGEQRKTIPPTLGEGYDHDNCNSDVLLTRMSVRNGRIILPDGMSYRVLILPDEQSMPSKDLEKVASLIESGATVVGPPPTGMAGMPVHPNEERKFDAMASRLWSGLDGTNVTRKKVRAGRLIRGRTARQVLQDDGVPPDFEEHGLSDAGTIDWIHRQSGGAEIYYVASRWEHPEKIDCTFRVAGKQPELWNPVTGVMRDATAFHQEKGRTILPLEFDPCGSIFVVFRKAIPTTLSGKTASNSLATQLQATLAGAWTVNFDPKWGGPKSVVFDSLTDWTNRPEAGIKYYSGTAVYHTQFDLKTLPAKGQRLLLDLGEVHEVASVRLNGRSLGVLWAKPARVDITDAAKAKDNDLEVTVVNLWPNRLIGDEALPKEWRFTETNIRKFGPASPLLPSGLIGPVGLLNVIY